MKSRGAILIVDDNDDIRANLKDILDDVGYETDTAENGEVALEKVRQRSYDVALLDYKMPGVDGASLYRAIRRICPETVAIMITAYSGSSGAQQALDAGTWRVLRKPVDFEVLLDLVEQAIREPVVLVVDDDEEFCLNLWQVLRDKGFRVCLAHSEQEAYEKASSPKVDIAILDVRIGTGDCRKVYQKIVEHHPEAKTVLVTGYRGEVDSIISKLSKDGPIGVEYKPIEFPSLLRILEQFEKN